MKAESIRITSVSNWTEQTEYMIPNYVDILFFNDKVGGTFITLGKEHRDRRIGINTASCEQKHFLSGLGDCGIGRNCNDLAGKETLIP